MNYAVRETVFQFGKMTGIEALVSHCYESFELHPEFLLQLRNRWDIAALAQFAQHLATDVPDTQVGTVCDLKRATLGSAKGATGLICAWWFQPRRCRPRKPERCQLWLRKQIPRVTRTTLPAGPVCRSGSNALAARLHLANAGRQFFTQLAQAKRESLLGRVSDTGFDLCCESSTHIAKFVGTRPGTEEPIENAMYPSKHLGEYTWPGAV